MGHDHQEASDYVFNTVKGTKALFATYDHKDPFLQHDVQWYYDINTFNSLADKTNESMREKLMKWGMNYDKTPLTGDVFGAWDEKAIQMTKGFNANFRFNKPAGGFIRKFNKLGGPNTCIIVNSQRRIQQGKTDEYCKQW